MNTQQTNWPPAKKLYLALSIMLTLTAIPVIWYLINYGAATEGSFNVLGFFYEVSGLCLAIGVLSRAKKDSVKKTGAVLGVITYSLAMLITLGFYALGRSSWRISIYYSSTVFNSGWFVFLSFLGLITWILAIAATIFSYINTFARKQEQPFVNYGDNMVHNVNNATPFTPQTPIAHQPLQPVGQVTNIQEPITFTPVETATPHIQAATPVTPVETMNPHGQAATPVAATETLTPHTQVANPATAMDAPLAQPQTTPIASTTVTQSTQSVTPAPKTSYVVQLTSELLGDEKAGGVTEKEDSIAVTADMLDFDHE